MIFKNDDLMAAVEARAAWQRAVNRCLVQEDAKRAPKLARCPSSAHLNALNNSDATNGQDQCASSFIPSGRNPMNSNLPSDTKWWLRTQSNFDYKMDFMHEQLKSTLNEHIVAEETIDRTPFSDEKVHGGFIENDNKKDASLESSCHVPAYSVERDFETQIQDMKVLSSASLQRTLKHKVRIEACNCQQKHFDTKSIDHLSFQKTGTMNFKLETPWERSNKCEPWWRASDKEELAYFVAQKSLENFENCDLPRPAHVCRNPFACLENWEGSLLLSSSLGIDYSEKRCEVGGKDGKCLHSNEAHPPLLTEKMGSDARSSTIESVDPSESKPNSDPNRKKLLEALCISQTRARKAELAAKKAYDEKEHIVKLLFKQASHLFAYKQWLQILQLESLFLQLRIKDQQITSAFPILPGMPLNAKPSDPRRKGKKLNKCKLCRYAFLLALGLGLAGAGLFFGCFFGWLSPNF